jgi:hypothetical protein
MDTFSFPFHRVSHEWPQNSTQVAFGGGYLWASEPNAPAQRKFTLKMGGMQWFVDDEGAPDKDTAPDRNLGLLDDFYAVHQLWQSFVYPHPYYGNITVKFQSPLKLPDPMAGGGGVVPEFDITFIEQP